MAGTHWENGEVVKCKTVAVVGGVPRGFCKGTCAVSLSEVFFHRVSVLRIDQAAVTVTWYAMMPRARAHKTTAARDAAREACPLMQRKRRRWYLRRGLLNQPC